MACTPSIAAIIAAAHDDAKACADGRFATTVPVFRELIADLETPVSTFLKLRHSRTPGGAHEHYAFLFESVEGGERLARYSFVGTDPFDVVRIGESADTSSGLHGDPMTHLHERLAGERALPLGPTVRLPEFTGGAVGYVSYDAVRHFEPRTARYVNAQRDVLHVPEAVFMMVRTLVVFDHVRHTVKVLTHVPLRWLSSGSVDEDALSREYSQAVTRIDAVCARLAAPVPAHVHTSLPAVLSPLRSHSGAAVTAGSAPHASESDWAASSNVGKDGYEGMVRTLKSHIVKGDIIQAVPSQRVKRVLPEGVGAFDLYRQLRVVNPSPYMFYLDLGPDFQIVGASPEMLVKVDEKGTVYTHPIAGTRRRGATPEEDEALAQELLADEKERAEHVMLVDLGRNDIGRVAAPGTVRVDSLMHIERYSHVMHIVSTVSGKLAPGKTAFDAFRSIFPAGTVSGAPKVRAVELVAGLEQERRHIYAGAVGYVGFNGVMDTAIAIRTMVVRNNTVYLQAGAGIVFDSDPTFEYDETCSKLRGVMRAVEAATGASATALPLLSTL